MLVISNTHNCTSRLEELEDLELSQNVMISEEEADAITAKRAAAENPSTHHRSFAAICC